jgi:hypothetical protein
MGRVEHATLSGIRVVGMGSAGRRPAVLGGVSSTSVFRGVGRLAVTRAAWTEVVAGPATTARGPRAVPIIFLFPKPAEPGRTTAHLS